MSLVFETAIYFDIGSEAAVIWADTPVGGRFRLAVAPSYIRQCRRGRLRGALQQTVRVNFPRFRELAEAAFLRGECELLLS